VKLKEGESSACFGKDICLALSRNLLDVLVFHCFHVETNGWNGGHDFAEFEFVQDGRLSRCVETDHQDSHVFRAKVVEQ
jgi:hypothetical protein